MKLEIEVANMYTFGQDRMQVVAGAIFVNLQTWKYIKSLSITFGHLAIYV